MKRINLSINNLLVVLLLVRSTKENLNSRIITYQKYKRKPKQILIHNIILTN